MDDFLVGPQSDEYTWWDYEMMFGDEFEEVHLSNDCQPSTAKDGEGNADPEK